MEEIAIIGAGIAGLTLALTLAKHSIPVRIYESRSSTAGPSLGGAMMLSPNSLSLFDRLGAYEALVPISYPFSAVHYKDANEQTTDSYPMGSRELYGYPALRIYRRDLYAILVQLCIARGVHLEYNAKFTHIVSECEGKEEKDNTSTIGFGVGVRFAFADGTERSAALLIASDGIHSTVRSHITNKTPVFVGLMGVAFTAQTKNLRIPPSVANDRDKENGRDEKKKNMYEFPVTITTTAGNIVMAPQKADGSEMMTGRQFTIPEELSRQGWEDLSNNKPLLKTMMRENISSFPDIAQSAVEEIDEKSMYIWPFYKLPRLDVWASEAGGVVLMGDAAHAIPPTTGQGAGMAVEDGVTLGEVLVAARKGRIGWGQGLKWWQGVRQDRMDDLVTLTGKLNNRRLSSEKQAALNRDEVWCDEKRMDQRQMAWLYEPGVVEEVEKWVENQRHGK